MSLSNSAETNLLKLLFNNTTWGNIGDVTGLVGSGAAGSFYVAFHTADPGEAGDQTTSEATYGGYARVAVARTTGGFTVSADTVSNAAQVSAASWASGSTNTLTYFSIGRASSGAGEILVSGALTNPVVMSAGNPTANFAIGALTATAA